MATQRLSRVMTLAIQKFDRSLPLLNRTVPMENIMANHVPAGVPGVMGVLKGYFDAAEIPLARLAFVTDQADPVKGVPVFPDRLFVQQYVYVRADSDIYSLADLRGKKVHVPGYFITASLWHRAALQEAGVEPKEVEWTTSIPELDDRQSFPDGVKITYVPSPYLGMERLLDGTADCLMSEATPPVPPNQRDKVRRLYTNAQELQKDYYKRTGFNPIVHVIVATNEALKAWPDFGVELCRVYDEAKAQAYQWLQNERTNTIPLMRGYLDETMDMFGDDPWPYGLGPNRAEIDQFLQYAQEQGLTRRRLVPEELFDERSLSYQFAAKMEPGSEPGGGVWPGAVI
jgi:4,5-dihydroxyphthalate decarboxylase